MSFTIVDDRDTERIQYAGNWELTGNATRTLSQAAERGLTASFRFKGDYVAVFGTTLPPPFGVVQTIRMEYQVDERDPIIRVWNSTKINAPPYETSSLWFSSWIPSDREHTLSIRYLEGDTGFLFDYIEYREALVISTNVNTTSFPTSTLTPAGPRTSSFNNRVLTITLSVVLGSIFVAILCLCFYFSRANRRAKKADARANQQPERQPDDQPEAQQPERDNVTNLQPNDQQVPSHLMTSLSNLLPPEATPIDAPEHRPFGRHARVEQPSS